MSQRKMFEKKTEKFFSPFFFVHMELFFYSRKSSVYTNFSVYFLGITHATTIFQNVGCAKNYMFIKKAVSVSVRGLFKQLICNNFLFLSCFFFALNILFVWRTNKCKSFWIENLLTNIEVDIFKKTMTSINIFNTNLFTKVLRII